MFTGFNLKIDETAILGDAFYEKGLQLLNKDKAIVERNLTEYVYENQFLDGSSIQNDWFPQIDADIFISHSHNDEQMVISLAGWLYDIFGLKAFVDSCVWGYANDLLKKIDDEFCMNEKNNQNKSYIYEKRNYSTSHVHMMLSTALIKMIDKTECLFFINTPDSIAISDTIQNGTYSPWIYSELQISEVIRHRKLSEYRPGLIEKKAQFEMAQLKIKYDVQIDHLISLTNGDLLYWWKNGRKNLCDNPLDILYEHKGLIPKIINE